MRIGLTGGTVALLVMAQAVGAQEAKVTIEGTSTLRSWSCEAPAERMTPQPARGFEDGLLRGEKSLDAVTVTFRVDSIECGNGTMNEHLVKALQSDRHPSITYAMTGYDLVAAASGMAASAQGRLTIAGTERPITMDVTIEQGASGLRVRGEHEIRMTEYGVQPPRLMLGTLKVGEVVVVKFDVPLRVQPAAVAGTGLDAAR